MEILGIKVKGDRKDREEDDKEKTHRTLASVLTGEQGESADQCDGPFERRRLKQLQGSEGPFEDETVLHWRNRRGTRHMAASIVGTSQYMAPEVIRGEPYDGRCD